MRTHKHPFFEESPEIKVIIDKQDYKIVEANKSARKLFKNLRNNKGNKYLSDIFPAGVSHKQLKRITNNSSKKLAYFLHRS